jgi:NADPH-dependent 2,4-dienoyl-CoA reductase/sulfur reductase-like enzyme
MLHTRRIHVTFLVRERSYWNRILPDEESAMVNRIIRREGIDIELSTELERVVDDGTGRATGVVTKDGRKIACQLVGLTTGVVPNVDVARDAEFPETRRARRRELPHERRRVYAAGDCASCRRTMRRDVSSSCGTRARCTARCSRACSPATVRRTTAACGSTPPSSSISSTRRTGS